MEAPHSHYPQELLTSCLVSCKFLPFSSLTTLVAMEKCPNQETVGNAAMLSGAKELHKFKPATEYLF